MKKIDELIEGYFEGTLAQDEETALKVFLASEEGQGPEYDEVRAVMGYFAAGRRFGSPVADGEDSSASPRSAPYPGKCSSEEPSIAGKSTIRTKSLVAIAASMAIIITLGINIFNQNNICVSFVGGKKITDREVVMNDVDNILADLLSDRVDMEEQLESIFGE
jgi:hypothetical protein